VRTDHIRLRRIVRRLIEGPDYAAGIVVMRKFADGLRVLCLWNGAEADIPKGQMEPDDDGALDAGLRELREEAGITAIEFPWGKDSVVVGNMTAYVGLTEQDVAIRPNPVTGDVEHTDSEWIPASQAAATFSGDLAHIVGWAILRTHTY
jgi:8-oxo-dGTP pyrophosphatase MutT (NUDIX family)